MVESILTVVLEVVKCLAPPTERQLIYLRGYNNNIENLKGEVGKLKDDSESIQHAVDEAKRKGEEIEKKVEKWLDSVNNAIADAEKFAGDEAAANKQCFKGLCPNLKTRIQHSKEALRQLEAIVKLREAGRFDRISYRSLPEDIVIMSNKDYEAFESRMSTVNDILSALKTPDVSMLGIYGMGGIGKTTLAKEVARKVENDKLFDQVIFTEVSQNQDIRKIQGEIADKLGLTFCEESESGRARSLCNQLKKNKTILIILDNIWENLDLLAVGIPHGNDHKGCKILLTARSEDTLSRKMDSKQNFSVGVLKEEEAWSLFKKMAGDYIEGSEFKSVAMDVAKECAGLPVSIVTVARALRNKSLFEWKDALQQLRRPYSTNFRDVQPTAYSAIELSYNKLEGEELKQIFLLIGYTYIELIDDLLWYGIGLGLFQGINNMEEARARVRTLVNKLKASCMLLDDDENIYMHDVVRDVAISIASREQNVFTATDELVNGWEWSDESRVKHYTSIVILDVKTYVLPEVVECPQLRLFSMRAERNSFFAVPHNLFRRMLQVRVLDLTDMNLSSLPSSIGLLTNLHTFCLYGCVLKDIAVIGDLKKLEILSLQGSSICQLPVEVGQLTRLRSLDLRHCKKLQIIPPNVLSNLSHLEELYILSFNKWEVEVVDGVKNASLEELKHLPNLTSLELYVHDAKDLPRGGLFFEKLERYKIFTGDRWSWGLYRSPNKSYRSFRIDLDANVRLKDGLMVQLRGVEELSLAGLLDQDIKNFVNELVKVGSSQLKYLQIDGYRPPLLSVLNKEGTTDMRSSEIILEDDAIVSNSLFIEKVALPNLETLELDTILNIERIWQNQAAAMSCGIQNLTRLIIRSLRNLRCLFSSSVVISFARLQYLEIRWCTIMEEIVNVDREYREEERKTVLFPLLQVLKMIGLEKLTSICARDAHIEFPSLKELSIVNCPEFAVDFSKQHHVFPNLEELRVDVKHITTKRHFPEDLLCNLKCLDIFFAESTTILSLDDFFQRLHTMKVLKVEGGECIGLSNEKIENGMSAIIRKANKCLDLKHIIKQESFNMDNLVHLQVRWCHNLISLVPSMTSLQNLTTLKVWSSKGLENIMTSSTAKSLVRLSRLEIGECEMIMEIVADDDDVAAKDEIVFKDLKELELSDLKSLTSFCSGNCCFKFPSLERLAVDNCPNMKVFSRGELSTHKLMLFRWDRQTWSWMIEDDGTHKAFEVHWTWKGNVNTTIQHLYQKRLEREKEENDRSTKVTNAEGSENESSEEDLGQASMQHLEDE